MVDESRLAGIRRYWTRAEIDEAYRQILAIDWKQAKDKTVVVGKSNADASASAQVVVTQQTAPMWMAIFEARLKELDAVDAGTGTLFQGTEHVNFAGRYIDP